MLTYYYSYSIAVVSDDKHVFKEVRDRVVELLDEVSWGVPSYDIKRDMIVANGTLLVPSSRHITAEEQALNADDVPPYVGKHLFDKLIARVDDLHEHLTVTATVQLRSETELFAFDLL